MMLYKDRKHQRDNGTRMVKDEEDWHGLQTAYVEKEKFRLNLSNRLAVT